MPDNPAYLSNVTEDNASSQLLTVIIHSAQKIYISVSIYTVYRLNTSDVGYGRSFRTELRKNQVKSTMIRICFFGEQASGES